MGEKKRKRTREKEKKTDIEREGGRYLYIRIDRERERQRGRLELYFVQQTVNLFELSKICTLNALYVHLCVLLGCSLFAD